MNEIFYNIPEWNYFKKKTLPLGLVYIYVYIYIDQLVLVLLFTSKIQFLNNLLDLNVNWLLEINLHFLLKLSEMKVFRSKNIRQY